MSFSKSINSSFDNSEMSETLQKNLLCKKMNINCNDLNCLRSHSFDELVVTNCLYDTKCKNHRCPFVHSNNLPITKEEYYNRMYDYINPYVSYKTSICRFYNIGCKIENCRKAHSVDELVLSECDCYRDNCFFYHKYRDQNITKQEYFDRMKTCTKLINKTNKNSLCRYINIGCQRNDCPYAHSINELNAHECIFSNCKSKCVYLHKNETIDKQEYFERMLKHIEPFIPKSVICFKNLNSKNCNDLKCKYAHNYSELIITNCIRGKSCKKHCCPFKHPDEILSKNVYYNRMVTSKYPN